MISAMSPRPALVSDPFVQHNLEAAKRSLYALKAAGRTVVGERIKTGGSVVTPSPCTYLMLYLTTAERHAASNAVFVQQTARHATVYALSLAMHDHTDMLCHDPEHLLGSHEVTYSIRDGAKVEEELNQELRVLPGAKELSLDIVTCKEVRDPATPEHAFGTVSARMKGTNETLIYSPLARAGASSCFARFLKAAHSLQG